MTAGPLQLDDEDFWKNPARTRDQIQRPFMAEDKEVLLYDAPSVVAVDARQTAPTQALRVAKFATLSQRPFRTSAVAVAVDLENNVVHADLAVAPTERDVDPVVPAYTGPPVEGIGAETFTIDLRGRLGLSWVPGRCVARLIIWDTVTDAREIDLRRGSSGFVDPEVEKVHQEERRKTRVPALDPPPGIPLPFYRRDAQSLPIPAAEGIELSVPRVHLLDSEQPCVLRGAFRLPLLPRHVVPSAADAPGAESLREQLKSRLIAGEPLPTGVVPITLVLTGSQTTGPDMARMIVPTYDHVDGSAARPVATGHFAVDLRAFPGFDQDEQTWYLYAFSDRAMAGPVPIGLTRRPHAP